MFGVLARTYTLPLQSLARDFSAERSGPRYRTLSNSSLHSERRPCRKEAPRMRSPSEERAVQRMQILRQGSLFHLASLRPSTGCLSIDAASPIDLNPVPLGWCRQSRFLECCFYKGPAGGDASGGPPDSPSPSRDLVSPLLSPKSGAGHPPLPRSGRASLGPRCPPMQKVWGGGVAPETLQWRDQGHVVGTPGGRGPPKGGGEGPWSSTPHPQPHLLS